MRWTGLGLVSIVFVLSATVLSGQQSFLQEKIRFSYQNFNGVTIAEHIAWLEKEKNITVSYSSVTVNYNKTIRLKEAVYSIEDFLFRLLDDTDVYLSFIPPSKILVIPIKTPVKDIFFNLSGFVKDKITGEVLIGAVIESKSAGKLTFSNVAGYYNLLLPAGVHDLEVNYLGYKILNLSINIEKHSFQSLFLEFQNELPALVISRERVNYWNLGDHIDAFKTRECKSLLGESDPMNNVRVMPGVQSGGEGQGGLFVRGGGADQNLILLEGVPLYEASHTVGIASLFIEESVKEASLIKNGFPARYGGRLSSVMEVNLKEGNTTKHERLISVGIPGAKFHANGPIWKDKTSYNVSARTSWLNYYIQRFLLRFTNYDDIRLDYHDVVAKLVHRFSDNNKISLAFYTGGDRMSLAKTFNLDTVNYSFNSFDRNRLQWSNQLASLQWYFTPGSKWSFHTSLGFVKYKHRSRSSYIFNTVLQGFQKNDELDILSYSDIFSLHGKITADYFLNEKHTIKIGAEALGHVFNPVVKQSTILLAGEQENILDRDSVIRANETNFFVEDHFRMTRHLSFFGGLHGNMFSTTDATYASLQPRLNMVWKPRQNFTSSVAVSRMRQNIHLLVNLGLGLPSDLWVPSTNKVKPQDAWQVSWTNSLTIDDSHFLQLGTFFKKFNGLIEFQSPIDLFYFFINDTEVVPVYNTSRDWERNIFTGKGEAKGLEFLFQRREKIVNGWFSLTWSSSTRSFPDIDEGKVFPFKYDRPLDINTGLSWQINNNLSIAASFVYGTGNAFSLSTEEFTTILGTRIINSGTRNNRRLPDFHQMSLNINYARPFSKSGKLNLHFNVYNIYNRLNAYFIYIYKNPLTKEYLARKVSVLPFTPSLFFSVTF